MAGFEDDDFDFSDNGLDDLPANTLHALETAALLSTQHQNATQSIKPQAFQQRRPLVQPRRAPLHNTKPYLRAIEKHPEPPSSDYGYDDEIVVDLDEDSAPKTPSYRVAFSDQPAQWVPNAAAPQQESYPNQLHLSNTTYNGPGQLLKRHGVQESVGEEHTGVEESFVDAMDVDVDSKAPGPAASELQLRIEELERERGNLLKSVEEAKSAAMSKAGEIAIVRRNHDKVTKEYERRISVMQQAHADVVAKQKAELEKTKKDREMIETNNLFLEHDLAREAEKSKQMKRTLKDGAGGKAKAPAMSPAATPKRHHKILPFRDGFDDDDMVMLSPSKARRPKAVTPRQGGKRKRPVVDQSPIKPLQLSEPREKAKPPTPLEVPNREHELALLAKLERKQNHFELMRRLLNHRPMAGHERTFEGLTHHAFPSSPTKLLSSAVYDEIATWTPEIQSEDFPVKFCHIFMNLWEQCLKESFYAPIYLLVDAIRFILATEKIGVAIAITEKSLPLILASVDLVAIPIARASNPAFIPDRDAPQQIKLRREIDVVDCLTLLHTIATSCVTTTEAITKFWQCVPFDFVLVLLNKAQPLEQIMLMLRILSTSALPSTVGVIVPIDYAPEQQSTRETSLIDRLTLLLSENPIHPKVVGSATTSNSVYDSLAICELRVQVLRVLGSLCVHQYGGRVLAQHRHCIGRLVRFMHDQIDALYNYSTLMHSSTVDSINISMRIVYHLVTSFPDEIDMRARLGGILGGTHKHLVALTRLAFSDALVLEAGIEEEVVDAAHQLLDEYLSPEEGEALLQVFSSGRSVGEH